MKYGQPRYSDHTSLSTEIPYCFNNENPRHSATRSSHHPPDFGGASVHISIKQSPTKGDVCCVRNSDSVGWIFCMAKQNGSATSTCAGTSVAYELQTSVCSCSSGKCIEVRRLDSQYTYKETDLTLQALFASSFSSFTAPQI